MELGSDHTASFGSLSYTPSPINENEKGSGLTLNVALPHLHEVPTVSVAVYIQMSRQCSKLMQCLQMLET